MHWQAVETMPISVAAADAPACAAAARHALGAAIQQALVRRAVPLAVVRDGRAEPLATATLVLGAHGLALMTAAHAFDGVQVDDLAVALAREGRLLPLRGARLRVLVHPDGDVAVLRIARGALADRLLANWLPLQWDALGAASGSAAASLHVVAGYPSVQMRRVEGVLYARPVVLFTMAIAPQCYGYARVGVRSDGLDVHLPELDGVSGATVWAVAGWSPDDGACALHPVALQVAFQHGRHLRAEPITHAAELLRAVAA